MQGSGQGLHQAYAIFSASPQSQGSPSGLAPAIGVDACMQLEFVDLKGVIEKQTSVIESTACTLFYYSQPANCEWGTHVKRLGLCLKRLNVEPMVKHCMQTIKRCVKRFC